MDPPPTPLIKGKHNDKSDKYFVNIKLRRDTTSERSGLYEFKMALFDNENPEYFLLFVGNFNMNLEASGIIYTSLKAQYIRTLVHGEELCQFDTMSSDIESTTPLIVKLIIFGLGT